MADTHAPWPPIEWEDDFGHHYRLSCCPLTSGEVLFDVRCLDHDGQALHTNIPRRWAVDISARLRHAAKGRPPRVRPHSAPEATP